MSGKRYIIDSLGDSSLSTLRATVVGGVVSLKRGL